MTQLSPTLDATDWSALEPLYGELLARPLRCAGCVESLLLDRSELDAFVAETAANLYIEMTCHTDDEARRRAYLAFVEEVEPKLRQVGFELDRRIVEAPPAADLDAQRFGVLLRDLRCGVELFRPENIPLQTELTTLDQRYSAIAGAQTVQFDGAERTLAQMLRYQEEPDRALRDAAWRAVAERRLADRDAIDRIMDRMLDLRHEMAVNAGFRDFRDFQHRRLLRFDYTPRDCERFHESVAACCVPLARRLDRQRAAALGVDPLRPWDLAVDVEGRPPLRPFEGAEELVARTSTIFHRMRPSLGAMFDELRGGAALDLESRAGKAPGGYQYQRQHSRRPFIFMNASGLHRDVVTMVHEAGHAFHSTLSRDEPLLHYRSAPIEFSEVASMGMELLVLPWLGAFYDRDEDVRRATRVLFEDLVGKLGWIAQIDAFQHWIHVHAGHSRSERDDAWVALDRRFGHAIDWSGIEEPRRALWQKQLHLFGVPFYYIEYGIAQLGALQLWRCARRDPEATLDAYERALALGGSRPLPALFEAAGIRFDLSEPLVGELMEEVEAELEPGAV
ncbi:MAG TPA: M3 family oligoendopeptidase [Phycisphaerales bacterium]|nr:M3 family oligoendopeptidase [Phycisphaerales bacterium]HMP37412.1 M3 family oligoendopeptidase [Phycisphaerales bacterium]